MKHDTDAESSANPISASIGETQDVVRGDGIAVAECRERDQRDRDRLEQRVELLGRDGRVGEPLGDVGIVDQAPLDRDACDPQADHDDDRDRGQGAGPPAAARHRPDGAEDQVGEAAGAARAQQRLEDVVQRDEDQGDSGERAHDDHAGYRPKSVDGISI
ncbi:hypothetical protein M4I32_11635 [Microbacterium sp. LRZ72]|uniref:hypothetical protein n=1 Tax=Microbacterium sp. LRZ72 TaxID=2942481 RepID=UPI0029A833D9|nr:hypothetical protein [Microbacterium sp. LRZ72]MDX2377451.1 hypothetical protein [Microbacterium sp. LRZ72]